MNQYDLPPQTLLQQSSARPVGGEELETYGKYAADLYGKGSCSSLNEAVVETVKHAGLAPEQVRRVVEFTNTHAFLSEFNKEGTANKYVVFEQGPAEFGAVLGDLNDGGGGTVFDKGTLDYEQPPSVKVSSFSGPMCKTASVGTDDILAEAFAIDKKAIPLPFANPLQEVYELKDKLSSVRDLQTAEIIGLEGDLMAVTEDMYQHVKQAALNEESLGTVVHAWHDAMSPSSDLVKSAFAIIGPRLVEDGVFRTWDAMGASIEKTAGTRLAVNSGHPVVAAFGAYSSLVTKLAQVRSARQDVLDGIAQLEGFEVAASKHYGDVIK